MNKGKTPMALTLSRRKVGGILTGCSLVLSVGMLCGQTALAGNYAADINRSENASWKILEKRAGFLTKQTKNLRSLRSSIPIDDTNDTYKLGGGFDSAKGAFKGRSSIYVSALENHSDNTDANNDGFVDSATFTGNTELNLTIGVDQSYEQLLNNIRGGASASLNVAAFQVEGDIALAFENSSDQFTSSYTLFARAKPRKPVLLALDEPGTDQVGQGGGLFLGPAFDFWVDRGLSGDALMAKTGDEFIQAIELGSWLMVNISFKFRNAQDKKEIGGKLAVDWANGTVAVDGEADFSKVSNSESIDVTISAYQYGGDSANLLSIIGNQSSHSCTLNDPSTCLGYFENTILYAKDKLDGVTGYTAQFKDDDGNWLYNKFNPIRYITTRYDQSGPHFAEHLIDPIDKLTFKSRQALRTIKAKWEEALLHQRRANYLLTQRSAELNPSQLTKVSTIEGRADDNAYNLGQLAKQCLESEPERCATLWSEQTFMLSYDVSALAY